MMVVIGFLFKFLAWVVITVGCLVYGIWAILSQSIRKFNDVIVNGKTETETETIH